MRPHFVTIGAHTINVAAIARLYTYQPEGLHEFTVAGWLSNGSSFNLEGDEARQLLDFLSNPPGLDQWQEWPEWQWTVPK